MFLEKEVFSSVVQHAPLVSIDLIVKDQQSRVLLGKRTNEPAKGYWFVLGGRIYKDETLDTAFTRTVKDELGLDMSREEALFDKTYEHFYNNNVFNHSFSTHYVVLAHKIQIDTLPELNKQHSEYRWFEVEELLSSDDVHSYTKDYFR